MAATSLSLTSSAKMLLKRSLPHFLRNTQLRKLTTQPAAKSINLVEDNSRTMIDPLQHPDFFEVHNLFTVKDLFDAKVHLGHTIGTLKDQMRPFIYGSRLNHLIFDLDITADYLRHALNFVAHVAYRNGIILFITRNQMARHIVDKTAIECGEFSHTRKWSKGTLTNSTCEFKATTRLPDLCILLGTYNDAVAEHDAVISCAKMLIPTVGIVDSNSNPLLITYPIPGNDDSPSAITLYCNLFKMAILRAKQAREKLNPDPTE